MTLLRRFGANPLARRVMVALLMVGAIKLLVDRLDPFGMDAAVGQHAALVFARIAAPFHRGPEGQETVGQRLVTVVLIDRRYYDGIAADPGGGSSTWPLPVRTLVNGVIRPIVEAGPAALFVDIAFGDTPREIVPNGRNSREEASAALAQGLIDTAAASRVPLILANVFRDDPRAAGEACAGDFITPQGLVARSILAPEFLRTLGARAAPETVDAAPVGTDGRYQLVTRAIVAPGACRTAARAPAALRYVASPALALYMAFLDRCRRRADAAPGCRRDRTIREFPVRRDAAAIGGGVHGYRVSGPPGRWAMAPIWGTRMSRRMRETFGQAARADRCEAQLYPGRGEGLWLYAAQSLKPLRDLLARSMARPCPFIDTLSAIDLLDPRLFDPAADPARGEAILRRFIRGRLVLLGTFIPAAQDRIVSPLGDTIPGVYAHAVAIENLLNDGARFRRAEHGLGADLLLFALSVLLIATMTLLWEWLLARGSATQRWWREFILAPAVYVAIATVIGVWLIALLGRTTLPLAEIALPLMALHVIFFAGLLERISARLRTLIEVRTGLV